MARFCTCPNGLISGLRPAYADLLRRIDLGEEDRAVVATDLGINRNALGARLHRATSTDDCSCAPERGKGPEHGSQCGAPDRPLPG